LTGIYLVLAWVFSSWTRPIVVMAIIPFGLVGTIYGHHAWGVPLSMFTVVGLLGMTGIIINDSIVLVTTIDEHARERGVVPAIIEGAVDRLRPVFLTTATTVLGLMPLLFERSQQAQFLKPTVITLVYGLGFGVVMVLLVVPALVAMQEDLARQTRSLNRMLRVPVPVVRRAVLTAVLGLLAWLAVTMGATAINGSLPALLREALPMLNAVSPMPAALMIFTLGATMIILVLYAGLALTRRRVS
jgi:predicted RND superfamily exporter protein